MRAQPIQCSSFIHLRTPATASNHWRRQCCKKIYINWASCVCRINYPLVRLVGSALTCACVCVPCVAWRVHLSHRFPISCIIAAVSSRSSWSSLAAYLSSICQIKSDSLRFSLVCFINDCSFYVFSHVPLIIHIIMAFLFSACGFSVPLFNFAERYTHTHTHTEP